MDESEKLSDIGRFRRLLLCFQCQRVPVDLIARACRRKSTWSATGKIEWIQPHEGGIPRWLLDFWRVNQKLFDPDDGAAISGFDDLRLVNDYGVRYFEVQPSSTESLETDEGEENQEECTSQCIRVFTHAFPCRNTEVLGEEVAASLVPIAKAFLLPLLASVSEDDISDWLLPGEEKRKIEYVICLFDCLLQTFTFLGFDSPLNPIGFPRKVLNVLATSTAQGPRPEPCLNVFLGMIETVSTSSLETFERSLLNAFEDLDERSNTWIGLSLDLLLPSQTFKRSQALSDAITKASMCWRPKSITSPSPMEYLVAIELLPHAQLQTTSLPGSLGMELSILRGLLLSRMQYHHEAARVLYDTLPAAISHWGLASSQVGIVAAESANCYNMLRKEDVANTIATRCLAVRNTPELTNRPDWFYLNFCLIDSLVGGGRYAEAEPAIQHVLGQPSIPPTIHMMGCLRLSKIRRRAAGGDRVIFESYPSLQEGISLFRQVPSALQEECLEEVACTLSLTGTTQKSVQAQQTLLDAVEGVLGQTGSVESPARKRYAQAQLYFKQQVLRQEHATRTSAEDASQVVSTASGGQASKEETGSSTPVGTIAPIATRKVFSVPYERDKYFFQISEATEFVPPVPTEHGINVYSIHGEVGVGKTSFATNFAYEFKEYYGAIVWIRDAPLSEISDYLSSVAVQLGLAVPIRPDEAREQIFRWFAHPRKAGFKGPWLMVFDGIENKEVLRQLWPFEGQFGDVLVITREKPYFLMDWAGNGPEYIKLGQWDTEKAMQLASRHMVVPPYSLELFRRGQEEHPSKIHRKHKDVLFLVGLLEYHPAAIKQAASLITKRGMDVRDFIAAYRKVQAFGSNSRATNEMLRDEPNHNIHLITIWLLNPGDSGPLLNVISLLSPFKIPERLLWPSAAFAKPDGYPQSMSEFEEIRNHLLESSLIWRDSQQQSLHTSTTMQDIFIRRMDQPSFARAYYRALLLAAHAWPCKLEDCLFINYAPPIHADCSTLWSSISHLAQHSYRFSPSLSLLLEAAEILEALFDISWCLIKRGSHLEAEAFLNLADSIVVDTASQPSALRRTRQLCLLWHHRGTIDYMKGNYEEAGVYFRRCFVLAADGLGPGSRDSWSAHAVAHHGIGDVKRITGMIPEAIASYKMSIKALESLEKPCEGLLTVRVNLGVALLLNEQPEPAESILEQARLPIFGTSIADEISSSLRNFWLIYALAIAKLGQNKAEESLQLALECVDNIPTSISPTHDLFSRFHLIISSSYGRLSEWDLAQKHLHQASAGYDGEIWVSPKTPPTGVVGEQRRMYDMLSQGTWEHSEIDSGTRHFFDGGLLNMRFFAAYLAPIIP